MQTERGKGRRSRAKSEHADAAEPVLVKAPAPAAAEKRPAPPKVEPPPVSVVVEAPRPAPAPEPTEVKPKPAPDAPKAAPPDVEALSRNAARFVEEGGKALANYLAPREQGRVKAAPGVEVADVVKTFGKVFESYAADPKRSLEAQASFSQEFVKLWTSTLARMTGGAPPPAEDKNVDKRFADPEWRANPYFDFIRQTYSLASQWADEWVSGADAIDPQTRSKAKFYVKQISGALAPSNFLPTNPELLRTTFAENGANLVRGMQMMAEDIAAGNGELRIRQTDASKFKLGVNMAATPGKVVLRNDLMELIQYSPSTPDVAKRPLLIVPPWINKFYILDLNPEKSFIRWAVAQGLTVFVISWVNPDERHAAKDFEAYMREGILTGLDAIEAATGERDVSAIGYCVGGTLLAVTLAYMAAVGDVRISSATFFTTQTDFTDSGDLKIFVDAEQLKSVEEQMAAQGYLDGSKMANAFNMLRPNDLIWSYFVNNYLKGKEPMAFDLLVWNSDSTRMPAANHNFYLRHCYFQNDLTGGRMVIGGKTLDLKKVTIPIYNLAAREDHIAPAKSVYNGSKFFGGPTRYIMAGSGHIAGVVNPVDKPKYQYWSGGPPEGEFADWVAKAKETPGTWWPDWLAWLTAQAPAKVKAREPGEGKLKPICDAPGEYVRVRV